MPSAPSARRTSTPHPALTQKRRPSSLQQSLSATLGTVSRVWAGVVFRLLSKVLVDLGTELVGLQLKDLNDQQRDELALLVAERTVVFIRDQEITPQEQRELGLYLGDGEIEIHPQAPQVPDVGKHATSSQ